jgi:para-nitrobenzyl esterase
VTRFSTIQKLAMKASCNFSISVILTCLGCFGARSGSAQSAVSSPPVSNRVRTINGTVEGVFEKSGVISFKGIPFAAPPLGDLRWKAPQPAHNWKGVRKADKFGNRAMQPPIFSDMMFRSDSISEDCLFLNVWAPSKRTDKAFPVLVYFYGGGFVAGDGSEYRYDGESMAAKGIVSVTVNYRLGVFGLLALPELSQEASYHASGNYGLLDQQAALRWVQQNIAAFGGDPAKVTIAGESAGSISVCAQMASPLSKGLIAGAIGESGSILGALPATTLASAEQTGLEFQKACGAHSLAELRAMPASVILQTANKVGAFRFSMVIDGYFFPKSPYAIFAAGEQAHVPLLVGWNSQEMDYRMVMQNAQPTLDNYSKAVEKLYGEKGADVLKVYHAGTDDEVEQVATDLAGDRFIGFSTWKWADMQGRTGGHPVYRYMFARARPSTVANPDAPRPKGAVHSAEIEYAMGNLATNKVYNWTEDDYKVSRTMQEYFANFIKTGNPNGPGLPTWPAANQGNGVEVMHIDLDTKAMPESHRDRYLLMDQSAPRP